MRAQSWILNLVAAVIASSATVIAFAQEPQKQTLEKPAESTQSDQQKSKENVCTFTTFLITINVLVTDSDKRPVTDIRREDVTIFEDETKQEIEFWFNDNSPMSFSLAFDLSDREPLKLMARQTASRLVGQISSTDSIHIPQLKTDNETVRNFVADERKFESALNGILSNSRLAGIIAEAVKSERNKEDARNVMIVITDGLSLSEASDDRDTAYAILRQNRPLYFIVLAGERYGSRPVLQTKVRRTRRLLTRLAEVSGGLALVAKNEDEISAATEQIINRLKNQYRVAYYPTNDIADGSFRYIRVTVTPKDKRKVKVFAPSGYYALGPEEIK
jgi:VWFA-related protein